MSVIAFPTGAQAPNRLKCSACGIEVDAGCDCGAPYVPAAKRVADYDKANPGQSTRQAAADLGISNKTVSKARQAVTEVTPGATVAGRDGKNYPAKKSKTKEEVEIIERDRQTCIALYQKVKDADREKAQWLAEHPHAAAKVPVEPDLTVEEMAVAIKKFGTKKLIDALDLAPKENAELSRHFRRQHGHNKEMTNALRAGVGTNKPAANQAAITKIMMEMNRLDLDCNDISVVVRKPQPDDETEEPEFLETSSRLIPAGNVVDPAASAEKRKQDNAATDQVPA
jgi:hypothetical protein